jgi:integrase/recombinase XerD
MNRATTNQRRLLVPFFPPFGDTALAVRAKLHHRRFFTVMTRPKNSKQKSDSAPQAEPLDVLLHRHLAHLQVCNYSRRTLASRKLYLGYFVQWCAERGLESAAEIGGPELAAYQRYLYHYRTKKGQPLRFSTQLSRLVPLRVWFRWLVKQKCIPTNPAADMELPNEERRLPGNVLTPGEADAVMNQCDVNDPLGLRDRSMLETFYSTAMRRS